MTSGPITSWQIEGRKVETVTDFILLGSEITANDVCSHEIKKHLLLGRKGTTNLGSISKSRDVILPTKVCIVKVMVFPVVMYGCESWAIKKAACLCAKLLQLCPTLCDAMDCGPPSPSVHGILQARILEWIAMPSSRGASQPRDWTHISCLLH